MEEGHVFFCVSLFFLGIGSVVGAEIEEGFLTQRTSLGMTCFLERDELTQKKTRTLGVQSVRNPGNPRRRDCSLRGLRSE